MARSIVLSLIFLILLSCSTVERVEQLQIPPTPTPWLCSVEIESYFRIPEGGRLRKSSTLLMTKRADTEIVVARGTGTVIAIEGDVLTILTAKHVVFGAKDSWARFKDIGAQAYDVKHSENDVSIFKVKSAQLAKSRLAAPLATSVPAPGAQLSLVGNALGIGLKYMTPGPMGGDKPVKAMGCVVWEGSYHSYPGCSGGGIWADGKLVGVVSMVLVLNGMPLADMGFFVGVEYVHPLIQK